MNIKIHKKNLGLVFLLTTLLITILSAVFPSNAFAILVGPQKFCSGNLCIDENQCTYKGGTEACSSQTCVDNSDCNFNSTIGRITPPVPILIGGPAKLFGNILRIAFSIAGLWAFLNIIIAGFQFISAGGDPKAIQSAWGRIWQSLIGLIIIVGSFVLAAIIGFLVFGDVGYILRPAIFSIGSQ